MAGQSIGKASLVLGTKYAQLTAGLDKVYGRIQGFRNRVSAMAAGGFAGAAGGKLFADALETANHLADVGRQAKGIGAGTAEFMALGKAAERAGVQADEFGKLLGKMGTKNAAAQLGQGSAKALGLLGLQVEKIAGMRPDQQFVAIADAISKVADPSMQAYLATQFFEEEGAKLVPMLQKGGAELTAFIAKQKQLGTALGESDIAKLEKVKQAMPKVQAVFEGAWNKMVVAVAPLIEGIASRVTRLFERAQPGIDLFVHGFETVSLVVIAVFDEIAGVFDSIVATASDWVGTMFSGLDPAEQLDGIFKQMLHVWGTVYAYIGEVYRSIAAIGAMLASIWLEALRQATKALSDFLRMLNGIPAVQRLLGNSLGQLAGIGDAGAEELKKLSKAAEEFAGRNWFDPARAAQNAADFGKWVDKAMTRKKELEKPAVMPVVPVIPSTATNVLGAALQKGSKEEYSARVRAEFGGGQNAIFNRQLDAQKAANGHLAGIKGGIDTLNGKPAPAAAGVV